MTTPLKIERVEIIPLDTLPPLKRAISTGPISYARTIWSGDRS